MTQTLSIVIPAYREEGNVDRIYERLRAVLDTLDLDWELIFSVDPSPDRTEERILALRERDPRVKMLRFSRRFGQPMATLAGLEAASGDVIIVIDCDLQDPPELIPELVARWREGFDVVYAQRRSRTGETLAKRIVAWAGYKVINRIAEVDIPPNTGDFRLDEPSRGQERRGSEGRPWLPSRAWLVSSAFPRPACRTTVTRAPGAPSKYNQFFGSLAIGLNGLVGFSRYPLQLISLMGVAVSVLAFLLAIIYLGLKIGGVPFPIGNPTIVIVVAFFSGIQLLSLGVMGEYVGRIYDETRQRPKYIVESTYGWDDADGEISGGLQQEGTDAPASRPWAN